MKSFQYLTTVIALTLLASHQAVAAPASEIQARSDSQSNIYPEAFPLPSGNVAISNIGTIGNEIGLVTSNLPPNADATSSGKGTDANGDTVEWTSGPNSVNVKWTSPTGQTISESNIETVGNKIEGAVGNISPTAVNIIGN